MIRLWIILLVFYYLPGLSSAQQLVFNIYTPKGIGIYQKNTSYLLDMHGFSNFAGQSPITNKNGVRISYPGREKTV